MKNYRAGGVTTENAVAFGTFDGLHVGHRAVLNGLEGYRPIIVTFAVPPAQAAPRLLMTAEDKATAMAQLGVKEILNLNFSAVRNLSPTEFLDEIVHRFHPARIACGYNYRFGKNAAGNTDILTDYCEKNGISLYIAPCAEEDGITVSSTAIRRLLAQGKPEIANRLLYRRFGFTGTVLHGDTRGRTIGFPTANQKYPDELTPLRPGVYSVCAKVGKREYCGISNIGYRPTFKTKSVFCETNLFDFSGDLYGTELTLQPVRFIRSEKKFNSLSELKKAISEDVRMAKHLL